jgi:KDO2-lipid IV(A) lauroyltransferase
VTDFFDNFPTDNPEADTIRVTQELETWIKKYPSQYMWTHRRFKTRPEGEPSIY